MASIRFYFVEATFTHEREFFNAGSVEVRKELIFPVTKFNYRYASVELRELAKRLCDTGIKRSKKKSRQTNDIYTTELSGISNFSFYSIPRNFVSIPILFLQLINFKYKIAVLTNSKTYCKS